MEVCMMRWYNRRGVYLVREMTLPCGVLLHTYKGEQHHVALLSQDRTRVLFRASFPLPFGTYGSGVAALLPPQYAAPVSAALRLVLW
jgi:hypothetical protein